MSPDWDTGEKNPKRGRTVTGILLTLTDIFRQRTGRSLVPLFRGLVRLVCINTPGYGYRKIGGCNFYGPGEFLDACQEAIKTLVSRDEKIAVAMSTEGYTFWYDPKNLVRCGNVFSVNYNHLSWGSDGVIARVLFAHLCVAIQKARNLVPSNRAGHVAANKSAHVQTSHWLEANKLPAELVECYAKT